MGVEAVALGLAVTEAFTGQKQARDVRKAGEKRAKDVKVSAQVAQNKADAEKKQTILRKLRRRDRGGSDTPIRSTILSGGNVPASSGNKTLLGQ